MRLGGSTMRAVGSATRAGSATPAVASAIFAFGCALSAIGCTQLLGIEQQPFSPADARATDAAVELAWSTPTLFDFQMAGLDDPTLTADLRELYFNVTEDIYVTSRATATDAWGPATRVAALSTQSQETTIKISPDGLVIHFGRTVTGRGRELYVATRPTRESAWVDVEVVTELNSGGNDGDGALSLDKHLLVFTSDRIGGVVDLFASTRVDLASDWSTPTLIPELDSVAGSHSPSITGDGLTIVFYRDDGDLHIATRPSRDVAFSSPIPIPNINSAAFETDPWISHDGRHLVFYSERGGTGQLWESRLEPVGSRLPE